MNPADWFDEVAEGADQRKCDRGAVSNSDLLIGRGIIVIVRCKEKCRTIPASD